MALIDYNNGTATISINGGQPPFSYLLLQNGTAVNYPGVNFQNPVVSPNNSVIFGNSSDTSGTYGLPSGTYTCQVTDNAGCVTNTPAIVIGQTQEATTTTIATTTSTTLLQEYTSLTVDQSPVNEGLNILFTLESSNIPNGSMVDWDITGGITSDDISGSLAGSFTIQNNQAQYLATIESDEILEGQEIPNVDFPIRVENEQGVLEWGVLNSTKEFAGKRVILFGLPGAFTPTCSTKQVPGYQGNFKKFQSLKIDGIYCISVNDAFVMYKWGREQGAEKVRLLPDGNGEFTRKMGMLVDRSDHGMGLRSWRYSMLVEDESIAQVFAEPGLRDNPDGVPLDVASAETMLDHLRHG